MQVACKNCGTRYEFDAAVIPPSGYDAQCTQCGNIFFVAPASAVAAPPPAPAAPPPAPTPAPPVVVAERVAVTCQHCGAVYEFAASDIPAAGYDAQCTQCKGVFF